MSAMKLAASFVTALSITGLPAAAALAQSNPASGAANASNPASSSPNMSRRDASRSETTGAGSSSVDGPLTATGLDLDGPATRFPSGKTPE
jgi:hypothetical protein